MLQELVRTEKNKNRRKHYGQNMLDYGLILSLLVLVTVGTISAFHGYLASSTFDPLQRSL